ncbi:MAG: hypothetical protein KGL74_02915, partial [Elusimicrobia bacterium]|nr:hypothetical protein [Elusimicrobiota bacterium]
PRGGRLETAKNAGLVLFGAFYAWMAVQTAAPLPLSSPLFSTGFRLYLLLGPLSVLPAGLLALRRPGAAGAWLCASWIVSSGFIIRYNQTFAPARFFVLNNSPVFLVGAALLFAERGRRLAPAPRIGPERSPKGNLTLE